MMLLMVMRMVMMMVMMTSTATVTQARAKLNGDTSLMTYRGHCVLNTLLRSRFSPMFNTGQRYIYVGCATGAVVGTDTYLWCEYYIYDDSVMSLVIFLES